MNQLFLLLVLFFSQTLWASAGWEEIPVPGARCGNGETYKVYYRAGNPHKLAFHLQGGGVCWDEVSCRIHRMKYLISPRLLLPFDGFNSEDPKRSPVSDYSMVYFPYCTDDVFLGKHSARYGRMTMHHQGRANFEGALELLVGSRGEGARLDFSELSHFVMYGFSAGAIGSMYHILKLQNRLSSVAEKVLLLDAPGLHFGKRFWDKFSNTMLVDFSEALRSLGIDVVPGEGNLARAVPLLCDRLKDWRVGVLQGSRDIVMSRVFGNISVSDHHEQVWGPNGIVQLTEGRGSQCMTWVPRTEMHTFLVTDASASQLFRDRSRHSARDFLFEMLRPTP